MERTFRHLFSAITIYVLCIALRCSTSYAQTDAPGAVPINESTIVDTGRQLRSAIDEEYDRLDKARELKKSGYGHNDISAVVQKYIKIGSPIDQAERILQAAGFKIWPHSQRIWDGSHYSVRAEIDFYKTFFLFGKIVASVQLVQPAQDDYSIVTNLTAAFSSIVL